MNKRIKGNFQPKIMIPVPNPFAASQKMHKHLGGNFNHKNKSKGIQCRECEGYGHVQAECANTRKKKKSYVATWSDKEIEDQNEGGEVLTYPLALISMAIPKAISATISLVDTLLCKSLVSLPSTNEPEINAIKEESDDEEEIPDEEMAHS